MTPWLSWFLAYLLRAVQGTDGLLALGVLGELEGGGRNTAYALQN